MNDLNERILEAVQEAGARMDDYGQRSALGMARSWLDNQRPIEREKNPVDKYAARDDLAEQLVRILEGESRNDALEALANARAVINAPFLDPTMNGQRDKAIIPKPGQFEKARGAA